MRPNAPEGYDDVRSGKVKAKDLILMAMPGKHTHFAYREAHVCDIGEPVEDYMRVVRPRKAA